MPTLVGTLPTTRTERTKRKEKYHQLGIYTKQSVSQKEHYVLPSIFITALVSHLETSPPILNARACLNTVHSEDSGTLERTRTDTKKRMLIKKENKKHGWLKKRIKMYRERQIMYYVRTASHGRHSPRIPRRNIVIKQPSIVEHYPPHQHTTEPFF